MALTLIEARESVRNFLDEARTCAAQRLGFAAMLTVFPVILSVSEAMYYDREHAAAIDKTLFKEFVPHMIDKSWWFSRNVAHRLSDDEIAVKLCGLRNSLAHQNSLPKPVGLANTKSEVKAFLKATPTVEHAICVVEFVEAVRVTTDLIIRRYPRVCFDPNPRDDARNPAVQVIVPITMPDLSKTTTSASAARRPTDGKRK